MFDPKSHHRLFIFTCMLYFVCCVDVSEGGVTNLNVLTSRQSETKTTHLSTSNMSVVSNVADLFRRGESTTTAPITVEQAGVSAEPNRPQEIQLTNGEDVKIDNNNYIHVPQEGGKIQRIRIVQNNKKPTSGWRLLFNGVMIVPAFVSSKMGLVQPTVVSGDLTLLNAEPKDAETGKNKTIPRLESSSVDHSPSKSEYVHEPFAVSPPAQNTSEPFAEFGELLQILKKIWLKPLSIMGQMLSGDIFQGPFKNIKKIFSMLYEKFFSQWTYYLDERNRKAFFMKTGRIITTIHDLLG